MKKKKVTLKKTKKKKESFGVSGVKENESNPPINWEENFRFGNTPDTIKVENKIKLSMIDEEENRFLAGVMMINIIMLIVTFLL